MATVSPKLTGLPKLTGYRNSSQRPDYTPTPDRRYFVVRGRLWRLSNPGLEPAIHARLVQDLMAARRAVRDAPDSKGRIAARVRVDAAKKALGERGGVWWDDGAPDYNRRPAVNTPYAAWFNSLSAGRVHGPVKSAVQRSPGKPGSPGRRA
jgi:hypothetical protein